MGPLFLLALSGLVAQSLTVNPATITQTFPSNGTTVVSVTVTVVGAGSVALSPSTQSGGHWLAVSPAGSTQPLSFTVTMDPSGLPDGTYLGSVAAESVKIPVMILVGDPGPQLTADGVVNSASYESGAISPGEIITLFGTSIGPRIPYTGQIWDGVVSTRLAGVRVWIDNTPAPVLYAYPNEIAAVVPYTISGKSAVSVQVENVGTLTPAFQVAVQEATPALFTADGSGTGPVTALNDDGSVNSSANPAPAGSAVVFYATGIGTLSPAVPDGTIVSSSSVSIPSLAVSVTVGGENAEVDYAGAVPSLVAGRVQIKARIPPGTLSGDAAVTITAGKFTSKEGCTIAVQ